MGKTIVFSWKIDNVKYGYLCGPETENNNPIICDRITTDETLKAISNKVSAWSLGTYTEKFNALKSRISEYTGGVTISGSASDYYHSNDEKNFIVLTGKDGSNGVPQATTSLDESTLNKIKMYVDAKFATAKKQLDSDINTFTAKTTTQIEHINENLSSKIESAEQEIVAQNAIMANKLENASSSIAAATKIFDLEAANITVEKLNTAIEDSRTTKVWKDAAEEKLNAHDSMVEYCKEKVELDSVRVGNLNEKIEDYRSDTYNKISIIEKEVENVNTRVNTLKVGSASIQSEAQEQESPALSRGLDDVDSYVSETETIDNGDGTFDIKTTIGDEIFNVKVYGYGKKLRANGNEGVNGLILANNGIKYTDKSGSFISIINGNIKLSNSNGSGKIEIKDDGVYINGVKQ